MANRPKPARPPPGTMFVQRNESGRMEWTSWGRRERLERLLNKVRMQNRVLHERSPLSEDQKKHRIRLIDGLMDVDRHPVHATYALHDFIVFEREQLIRFSQDVEVAYGRVQAVKRKNPIHTGMKLERLIHESVERAESRHAELIRNDLQELNLLEKLLGKMAPVLHEVKELEREGRHEEADNLALGIYDEVYENGFIQKRLHARYRQMRGHNYRWNRARTENQ